MCYWTEKEVKDYSVKGKDENQEKLKEKEELFVKIINTLWREKNERTRERKIRKNI